MKFKNHINSPKRFLRFLFFRFYFVRFILSYFCHYDQAYAPHNTTSLFENVDIEYAISSLKNHGLYQGLKLPEHTLHELVEYTELHDCYAGGDPSLGFKIIDKDGLNNICEKSVYIADYFNVSEQCPTILKIANDPILQKIVYLYVGKTARFTGSSLTWTFPVVGSPYDIHRQESCNFHYDIDDFSSLRIFFYLTDVTTESGPHVCVKDSHIKKSIFHTLNLLSRKQKTEKIVSYYGSENIIQIYGEAGHGFIEDTFCFHKGTVPKIQPRLMLQLHFSINNYNNEKFNDSKEPATLRHFSEIQGNPVMTN